MAYDIFTDTISSLSGTIIVDIRVSDFAERTLLQYDGRIVVAGETYQLGNDDFVVMRFNANGSFDSSFDGDGMVMTSFGNYARTGDSILQSDGKILVAGAVGEARRGGDQALVRYNTNGSLDASFGSAGTVVNHIDGIFIERPVAVSLQADSKIVVVSNVSGGSDFVMVRYNNNGTLDATFGSGGYVRTDIGSENEANRIAIQADGKIVVAGGSRSLYSMGNADFIVERYNSDGSLDTSFDGDGRVVTDFGGVESLVGLTLQNDGKIVVAGSSNNKSGSINIVLARYNSDGSLDATFDGDGSLVAFLGQESEATDVVAQDDGKIVVTGIFDTFGEGSGERDFVVLRYHENGTLDTGFGDDGKVVTDFGADDISKSLSLQPDGKIVVAGFSEKDSSESNIVIVRYNSDGTLDTTFGAQADTHPEWQSYVVPTGLTFAPGQYVSLDLGAYASDLDGDPVLYYAIPGYMNGSVFTQIPGTQVLSLTPTADNHLLAGFQLGDLTPAGSYVMRVFADDDLSDTNAGPYFDVPVTVSAVSNANPYRLIPDSNLSDTLLYTFNAGQSVVGRIYDLNGDLVPDRGKLFTYWVDENSQIQSEIKLYTLTWSDYTHWTANRVHEVAFGTVFDELGRPLTLEIDGGDSMPIVWQSVITNGVLATVDMSYTDNGNPISAEMRIIDSNGDYFPDKVSYLATFAGNIVEEAHATLFGWNFDGSGHPTSLSLKIQDSTNDIDVFSGTINFDDGGTPASIQFPSGIIDSGDTLYGSAGNDLLNGDAGDNIIHGLAGDDTIYGNGGNDSLAGGLGKDIIDGGAGTFDWADYSDKSGDLQVIMNGAADATVHVNGIAEDTIRNIENIWGGSGNDWMQGDNADNLLHARAGNDTLYGGNGDDQLRGDTGNDVLDGGAGMDWADYREKMQNVAVVLNGSSDSIVYVNGVAEDTILNIENVFGGSGNDTLTGDGADNMFHGEGGNDLFFGGAGHDVFDGGDGSDWADYSDKSESVVVTLNGSTFAQVNLDGVYEDSIMNVENLVGGAGNDSFDGDGADNTFRGGPGNDMLNGGIGFDVADYSDKSAPIGVWMIDGADVTVVVNGIDEDTISNIEGIYGGSGNDTLSGDDQSNRLRGGAGNDSISGGMGNDTLRGGAGSDTLDGGAGIDTADYSYNTDATKAVTLTLNGASDATVSIGGIAEDTIRNIENVVGGAGNDSIFGDSNDNLLSGGLGNDTLRGGGGHDTIDGGVGNDWAVYGDKTDPVILALNGSSDASVYVNGSAEDTIRNIETVVGGSGNDSLTGDGLDNRFRGGSGSDTLDGGAGSDWADYFDKTTPVAVTLAGASNVTVFVNSVAEDTIRNIENIVGGTGNDSLTGDGLDNHFRGMAGNDTLDGGAGSDWVDYNEGANGRSVGVSVALNGSTDATVYVNGVAEDTILNIENVAGGSQADSLSGDGLANMLQGNSGNDTLYGDAGDDTLTGGIGNDDLHGGTGVDTAVFTSIYSGYMLSYDTGTGLLTVSGADGTDILDSVERLQFADMTYLPFNTAPVWQEYVIPTDVVYVPGQFVSINLTAHAIDKEGDPVIYYAVIGSMNSSVFTQVPGTSSVVLTATADGHLVAGFQIGDLSPSGEYVFRVYADDYTNDSIPGASFDVSFTVSGGNTSNYYQFYYPGSGNVFAWAGSNWFHIDIREDGDGNYHTWNATLTLYDQQNGRTSTENGTVFLSDTNSDGVPDHWSAWMTRPDTTSLMGDSDHDARPDGFFMDGSVEVPLVWQTPDEHGVVATFHYENNGETVVSGSLYDLDGNGEPDYARVTENGSLTTMQKITLIDSDHNGVADRIDVLKASFYNGALEIGVGGQPAGFWFSGENLAEKSNDSAPVLSLHHASVSIYNHKVPGIIDGADAKATDADGNMLVFTLDTVPKDASQKPLFSIDAVTGQISLTEAGAAAVGSALLSQTYSLTVRVTDGVEAHDQTAVLTVSLTDQPSSYDVTVNVGYWNSGEGLEGVREVLTEQATSHQTTGQDQGNGLYGFTSLTEGYYTATASKDVTTSDSQAIDMKDVGASLDLVFGGKSGSEPSSYQYLAADVNRDGKVGFRDAVGILKMVLHHESAPAAEWVGVPESVSNETMSSNNVNWPSADIPVTLDQDKEIELVGVLMGDVDGNWSMW